MAYSYFYSDTIFNSFVDVGITKLFRQIVLKHLMAIILSCFIPGYAGKTVQFGNNSQNHRTTVAYFLNKGKWDDSELDIILKKDILDQIMKVHEETKQPICLIIDDSISGKTDPSSQARHPIDDAYYHFSHLLGKQQYGHQWVTLMIACGDLCLPYDMVLYDKSKTKIEIAQDFANNFPELGDIAELYSLFDSWYTCEKVVGAFSQKGFHTIAAIKTNRKIKLHGQSVSIKELAENLSSCNPHFHFGPVTVNGRRYYVARVEGSLKGIDNVAVLLSYPAKAFGNPKCLRAFMCTDTRLTTLEILERYCLRWPIEIFFRTTKGKLGFADYELRSRKGMNRLMLVTRLAYIIGCKISPTKKFCDGYKIIAENIQKERVNYIYNLARAGYSLEYVYKEMKTPIVNMGDVD